LFNRVTKGQYAPGSTFKVVTGLAGVKGGLRGVFDTFLDTPQYVSPDSKDQRVFGSPTEASFGEIDRAKALMVSSDSFFYSIGNDLWAGRGTNPRALQEAAEELGFGAPTGVQLPGESGGRMASPEVKQALHDRYQEAFPEPRYFFGDNILAAIGQGILTVTPLQLANAYSAIANGGTLYAPNIASAVYEANTAGTLEPVLVRELGPRVLRRITFPEGYRDAVIRGLEGVVRNPLGTAYEVFQTYPTDAIPVVGKTGTAQDFTKKSERDNSLFAAFGPPDRPRYTVVAVMERSGFGSQAAAPVVRHVFEALSDPALIPRLEEAPPLGVEPPDAVPAAPLPGSPPIDSARERD
jgi:penicillin-binding protein 2